eukprot:NODE_281_length_10828_cov_0.749837.p4 type:complete len:366 gc:universal NODE_281_length_10828_cov_0.749837:8070-9167(+)
MYFFSILLLIIPNVNAMNLFHQSCQLANRVLFVTSLIFYSMTAIEKPTEVAALNELSNNCQVQIVEQPRITQLINMVTSGYSGTLQHIRSDFYKHVLYLSDKNFKFDFFPSNIRHSQLKTSTKSLIILNHVGANDFQVAMKILKKVGRLDQMRFVTLKGFESFQPFPKTPFASGITLHFKKMMRIIDALPVDTKNPNKNEKIFSDYAEQHKNENIALVLFPEGGLLSSSMYKSSNDIYKKKPENRPQQMYKNLNLPKAKALQYILKGFPGIDIFDVTTMYIKNGEMGDPSQVKFMGDQFSMINMILNGNKPDQIHAYVRKIDNPDENDDYQLWINQLWSDKDDILSEMFQSYKVKHNKQVLELNE